MAAPLENGRENVVLTYQLVVAPEGSTAQAEVALTHGFVHFVLFPITVAYPPFVTPLRAFVPQLATVEGTGVTTFAAVTVKALLTTTFDEELVKLVSHPANETHF